MYRHLPLHLELALQSDFDKWEGKNTRKAPAYSTIPLNVSQSACDASERTENLPRIGFLPLKVVPLIKVRLYI
jgi:hypothetical protein